MYIRDTIEQKLSKLPSDRVRMFFASAAERYVQFYSEFNRIDNYGDPAVIRDALDMAWRSVGRKDVDLAITEAMKDRVLECCPTYEHDSIVAIFAASACVCIRRALDRCVDLVAALDNLEELMDPIVVAIASDLLGGVAKITKSQKEWTWFLAKAEVDRRYIREAENINKDLDSLADFKTGDAPLSNSLKVRSQSHRWALEELIGPEYLEWG